MPIGIGMDSVLANLIIRKPIRAPVIKISTGIGDSDGFPAFDSDTSDSFAAPENSKWGFNITGGAEFHMPLTVFQVSPRSLAAIEGIKLGDIILSINEVDASQMTLATAREIIDSSYKLFIIFKSMEDEDIPLDQRKPGVEKAISMRVPEPMKPPEPPKEFVPVPLVEKKPWHPVMWPIPVPKEGEEIEEEAPHCRIMRNIKRFFKENKDNAELTQKQIEEILLCLPK